MNHGARDQVSRVGLPPYEQSHESARGNGVGLRQGPYCVRQASAESDFLAAFRLRFAVFNLELREGLESAYVTGQDFDDFDAVCDHLIVEGQASDTTKSVSSTSRPTSHSETV